MACACISDVSNMLRERNAALVTTMFANPERVVMSTYKIDSKKRGKTPSMIATYCPFCGERYGDVSAPDACLPAPAKASI